MDHLIVCTRKLSFNRQENIGCFGNIEPYSCDGQVETNFKFPSPPHLSNRHYISPKEHLPQNNTTSSSYSHSDSDSASDSDSIYSNSDVYEQECPRYDNQLLPYKKNKKSANRFRSSYNSRGYSTNSIPYKHKHSFAHYLPPIGVFWDIENCQVPKGRSAVAVAQAIRDRFFIGYREAEFLVVCDVKKENAQVVQELNDAQVNLIHVTSVCKNAADEKLRLSMRRFADLHGSPAAVVLVSGDVNFASDLCDIRHRKKMHVILLHNELCSESLILCANEHYNYTHLVEMLPLRNALRQCGNTPVEVIVSNLPGGIDPAKIRNRLKRLSENCGGRVGVINNCSTTIRFPTKEMAARAQKRMNKERVFNSQIVVSLPFAVKEESPPTSFISRPVVQTREENIQHIATTIQYSSNNMHSRFNINPVNPPATFENQTFGLYGQQVKGGFGMSQMNTGVDNSMRNHNPWLTSNSVGIQTWLNGPQIPINGARGSSINYNNGGRPISGIRDNQDQLCVTSQTQNSTTQPLPLKQSENWMRHGYPAAMNNGAPITILKRGPSGLSQTDSQRNTRPISNGGPPSYMMFGVNTSIPPPPIINVPRRVSPPTLVENTNPDDKSDAISYCPSHAKMTKPTDDKGWAELEMPALPYVKVSLNEFSTRLHSLISSHNNYLILATICDCYEAAFYEQIQTDDAGVPLEHIVTAVNGVELLQSCSVGVKYLTTSSTSDVGNMSTRSSTLESDTKSEASVSGVKSISPPLANNMALLSRELVDLLKTCTHCTMSFNRFIPAYHHHFGRQCRVADYGFTKLIDLLEALPNIVQVFGEGNKRFITLAHKAQMRRFTSDLLRVLKSVASKQVPILEFATLFEKTLGRVFDPVDYGLCSLDDLLSQVSENTVVIGHLDGQKSVAIPKREQTPEEIERTKAFSKEVIELLSHAPQCSLLFNKFIPSYHHHFGHQCKVADFGFTKLIELFEAIPHIVKIEDDLEGERRVSLTTEVKQNVLGEQLAALAIYPLQISQLQNAFLWQYGYGLKPSMYECETLMELLQKLDDAVKVVDNHGELFLIAVDRKEAHRLSLKVRRVLMEHSSNDKMSVLQFQSVYHTMFGESITIETIQEKLSETVNIIKTKFGEEYIQLTTLQLFAQNMYRLLLLSDGRLLFSSLEAAYLRLFGTAIQPAVYGYQSVIALLTSISHTVLIVNKPPKRYIELNKELASVGIRVPNTIMKTPKLDELENNQSMICTKIHEESYNETNAYLLDENNKTPIVKLPDLKLHPNIFNMSPMSLVNCSSPQAPHPSQVPMPTELCPPFGDKFKPITTINNNNQYNNNQFCCPMISNTQSNDQSNQCLVQLNDRFHL
ncbi:meiosis regulator and mRNA stability factor 1 isoform X3 [Sipha flava]|uniref:Meiosis regulator and mRNA stability factor 1 isoform X3 n=2 Tax=Sipha flava TaxID=143950 RepID=A0A8B8FEA8_9HEMI|nr:meiosis regulator and mRNA stability factor 1 isoform X3 [Sipha flava]